MVLNMDNVDILSGMDDLAVELNKDNLDLVRLPFNFQTYMCVLKYMNKIDLSS